MKRLTQRENGQAYFLQCFEKPCDGRGCKKENCGFIDLVCQRLAAYEDTGLTPKEINKIK